MKYLFSVPLRALLSACIVQGAPSVRRVGFSAECSSIRLDGPWLAALCPKRNGPSIESTVYLGFQIGNREGNLEWGINGSFQGSCKDCTLLNRGSVLQCTCQTGGRPTRTTSINLEEHISNHNGHLLSDLAGPPTVPVDKSFKYPGYVEYSVQPSSGNTCGPGFSLSADRPYVCFSFEIATSYWLEWETARFLRGNPGYEVLAYESKDCIGSPIGRIGVQGAASCTTFSGKAKGLSILPLWNWS
ncbi:Cyanovirin-N [Patellaria atrata CBS 101060]|uniref:Cyanovirin-N n=1 Tax=Patellaria atrata CBS 101060 TaxID=1346257 RepID=A0A9P4VNU6_9PEZI|nr:Cyanovirin-N [Patellaria atrata CBS 101060]